MEKRLLKAQKGEMDAVIMYRKLAEKMKTEEERKMILSVAADEGKHAAILKRYTKTVVKGTSGKAFVVNLLYQVLGREKAFRIISKGEYDAVNTYQPLLEKYPDIQEIMKDETRHGDIFQELARRK